MHNVQSYTEVVHSLVSGKSDKKILLSAAIAVLSKSSLPYSVSFFTIAFNGIVQLFGLFDTR